MRTIMNSLFVLSLILLPGALSSVQAQALKTVATFSILGDWVANVGGDEIELVVLVGPDADSHGYEPTPRDMLAIAGADIVFENGLGFETWLDALYDASGSRAQRVVVTQGVDPIAAAESGAQHDHHHEDHDHDPDHDHDHDHHHEDHGHEGHDHGEFDPHTWHDVRNAVIAVELIRDALAEADPANAASYRANAASYLEELEALDALVSLEASRLPEQRRKLVTNHHSMGYFARAYGFEVIGTLLPLSTDVGEAAAGDMSALIDAIRAAGIPALFVENVANSSLIERIAAEAGVTVAPSLYTDALGAPGSAGDTYLNMFRHNLAVITAALSR